MSTRTKEIKAFMTMKGIEELQLKGHFSEIHNGKWDRDRVEVTVKVPEKVYEITERDFDKAIEAVKRELSKTRPQPQAAPYYISCNVKDLKEELLK